MAFTAIEQKIYNKAHKLSSYRNEFDNCTSMSHGQVLSSSYSPIKADDMPLDKYLASLKAKKVALKPVEVVTVEDVMALVG